MKNLILFGALLLPTLSLSQVDAELEAQKKKLAEEIELNNKGLEQQQKSLQQAQADLITHQTTLKRLQDNKTNEKANISRISSEIDDVLKEMSATQRIVGKKGAFYRCLKDGLAYRQFMSIKDCNAGRNLRFDSREAKILNEWSSTVGLSPDQYKKLLAETKKGIAESASKIERFEKLFQSTLDYKRVLEDRQTMIKDQEHGVSLLAKHQDILNCNESSPEVSLEEKTPFPGATFSGPFVGVPRDNQDGLGTCYANTAKNLLVSASQGQDVASFLDLALVYKGGSGVIATGLDGGGSCQVLSKTEKKGYCPQEFSPFESGNKNVLIEDLLGKSTSSVWDQSRVVKLLQKFFAGQDQLNRGDKELSAQVLGRAKFIIDEIKVNPKIKLPLPILRHPIPSEWKMAEYAATQERAGNGFNKEEFYKDYKSEYKKFYPLYAKAVLEGRSQDQIFKSFLTSMTGFIEKYNMQGQTEVWKRLFTNDSKGDFLDPNSRQILKESISFLKTIAGHESKSDAEFIEFCTNSGQDMLVFLESLHPLLAHLGDLKVDTDILFDQNGNFRSPTDLMQLAIAPSCLNKENRKTPKVGIICKEGYDTVNKIKASKQSLQMQTLDLRKKVVESLVQGYALGNTFGNHINTIVGIRYNKERKECEYKIRESQTGTSGWQSEKWIFKDIKALTEVRKR